MTSAGSSPDVAWRAVRCADWQQLSALADEARVALPLASDLDDVEYSAISRGWPHDQTLLLMGRHAERLLGFAAFGKQTMPLVYALGPWILRRTPVQRLTFRPGPLLAGTDPAFDIDGCFVCLADHMTSDEAAFGLMVPAGSRLEQRIRDPDGEVQRCFHVLSWGEPRPSYSIAWDGSVENYLRTISSNSRHDLRRRRRKLKEDTTLRSEVRCFSTEGDVDAFLLDGVRVSDASWQRAANVGGIQYGGPVEHKIRRAARRGEFRGYILYLNDQPAAYQYCFLYHETCTVDQIGYDPRWAERHHVGSILFFEVLHHFERERMAVRTIDFLSGVTTFKARTTNTVTFGQDYFFFKRSAVGAARYHSLHALNFASAFGKRMAERTGRLKRSGRNAGTNA